MAKRQYTKGTKQLATEVNADLLDQFRGWVEGRGEKLRAHIELAIRRHMETPPPPLVPEVTPLPPVGEPAKKKGKAK